MSKTRCHRRDIKPRDHFKGDTVIRELDPDRYGHRKFLVQCSCGETRVSLVDNLGCLCSKCVSKVKSEKAVRSWKDPLVRSKRIKGASKPRTIVMTQEAKGKISATLTGRKVPPDVIEKRSRTYQARLKAGIYEATRPKTRKPPTLETKVRIAASLTGRKRPQEVSRKVSISITRRWKDPEYRSKVLEARRTSPNLLEQAASLDLESLGFKFVGDGSFWVHSKDGSHNPDFRRPGSKLLIEIWGDYWHAGEKPEDLVSWYAEKGWVCLVIWEHEIKVTPIESIVQERLLSL